MARFWMLQVADSRSWIRSGIKPDRSPAINICNKKAKKEGHNADF